MNGDAAARLVTGRKTVERQGRSAALLAAAGRRVSAASAAGLISSSRCAPSTSSSPSIQRDADHTCVRLLLTADLDRPDVAIDVDAKRAEPAIRENDQSNTVAEDHVSSARELRSRLVHRARLDRRCRRPSYLSPSNSWRVRSKCPKFRAMTPRTRHAAASRSYSRTANGTALAGSGRSLLRADRELWWVGCFRQRRTARRFRRRPGGRQWPGRRRWLRLGWGTRGRYLG